MTTSIMNNLKNVINIIEEKDNTKIATTTYLNKTIWLHGSTDETELYLKIMPDRLVISRMGFKNMRKGIGTEVLRELEKICKEDGFKYIEVESVITKEMNNFCIKHEFNRVKFSGFEDNGIWYGNYRKEVL